MESKTTSDQIKKKTKNVIKIKIKTKLIMAPNKSTHPFFPLLGYNFSLDQSFVLSLKKVIILANFSKTPSLCFFYKLMKSFLTNFVKVLSEFELAKF